MRRKLHAEVHRGEWWGTSEPHSEHINMSTKTSAAAHAICFKLTWLVLGGDPAARSHRVEQFTAL